MMNYFLFQSHHTEEVAGVAYMKVKHCQGEELNNYNILLHDVYHEAWGM